MSARAPVYGEERGAVISCQGLEFAYEREPVLHGVDFSVPPAGITGLLGKNGAGKSTIINILMGFLRPQKGRCHVLGHPSHAIPPLARGEIGLLHEGFIQFDYMSLAEIERFYAAFYPRWNPRWFFELMDRLDVPASRRVARMSCGQRSQVALGLILAQEPRLMILDDYSMGLDVGYRRLFLELLRDYVDRRRVAAFLTSHVVRELDQVVDNVVILRKGRVIAAGSRSEIMAGLRQYRLPKNEQTQALSVDEILLGVERHPAHIAVYTREDGEGLRAHLARLGLGGGFDGDGGMEFAPVPMDLEDVFVGMTGRY